MLSFVRVLFVTPSQRFDLPVCTSSPQGVIPPCHQLITLNQRSELFYCKSPKDPRWSPLPDWFRCEGKGQRLSEVWLGTWPGRNSIKVGFIKILRIIIILCDSQQLLPHLSCEWPRWFMSSCWCYSPVSLAVSPLISVAWTLFYLSSINWHPSKDRWHHVHLQYPS